MCVFPWEKPWFSRLDTFIFSCFFNDFSIIFRHRILYRFFMILDAISVPFSIPFRPFGHHFGILFRYRIFDDLWMPFWTTFGSNSTHRAGRRSVVFFIKNHVFSGPRSGIDFWWILMVFWSDFAWIFMKFGPILEHLASLFALFGSISLSYVSSLHFLPHQLFKPGASIFRPTFTAMKKETIRATI